MSNQSGSSQLNSTKGAEDAGFKNQSDQKAMSKKIIFNRLLASPSGEGFKVLVPTLSISLLLGFFYCFAYRAPVSPLAPELPRELQEFQAFRPNASSCLEFSQGYSGLITARPRGQLGNEMGEYASILALAHIKGARPVFYLKMMETLKPLFPDISEVDILKAVSGFF